MGARFAGPRRRWIDFEIALPRAARFVGKTEAFHDQATIEQCLGQIRIDAQCGIGSRERARIERGPSQLRGGGVARGGEIAPRLRIVFLIGCGFESRDALGRTLHEHHRHTRRVLRIGVAIAIGALDHLPRRTGELHLLRIGVRRGRPLGSRVLGPGESTGEPRLDDARGVRRECHEPRNRIVAAEQERRGNDRDQSRGRDSQPSGERTSRPPASLFRADETSAPLFAALGVRRQHG